MNTKTEDQPTDSNSTSSAKAVDSNALFSVPPKVFTDKPFSSILQKSEAETIARNVMVIRDRLGKWELTAEEYQREREKDGSFTLGELGYFKEVAPLIRDSVGAMNFCETWQKAGRRFLEENAEISHPTKED